MKKLIIILLLSIGMATTSFTTAQPMDELQGAEAPEICTEGLIAREISAAPVTEKTEQVAVKLDNAEVSTVYEACEPEQQVNSQVRYYEEIPLSAELQEVLFDTCDKYGIPYEIALGLIETESRFQSGAVSDARCYGLCQLNPMYFPSGLSDADNIRYGLAFLADRINYYNGDIVRGLQGYTNYLDNGDRLYPNTVLAYAAQWEAVLA